MLTHVAAALYMPAPAIICTGSVLVVSSICDSFMNDKVAGMAEMLRMCIRIIIVNGNSEDLHQFFRVLGTGVLHLSRFGLSRLTTVPAQIV